MKSAGRDTARAVRSGSESMSDSGQNDAMDPRDEKALILGGMVAVIITGLALSFFQSDSQETFDIWRLVQVFCIVSITTFAISYSFIRYILMRKTARKSMAGHFILSVFSYPFRLSPLVKGIIALGIACAGIILYFFYYGQQPVTILLCSLFGIPLVAFLNNTFGERRNEKGVVVIYLTILILIFTILFFGPLIYINGKFNSFSLFWFLTAVLFIAYLIHSFYPGLFALTEEEQKDTLERYFSLAVPYDQEFDLCQTALQRIFLGRITSSNPQTGMINLKTPFSRYTIKIIRSYDQQSRVRIQRDDAGRIYTGGFWKKWYIQSLDRICRAIMEEESTDLQIQEYYEGKTGSSDK
jgi:hypothetical protein